MDFHLALDQPEIKEFLAGLDDINALAEPAPGLVNRPVWKSAQDQFVYRSSHFESYFKRSHWFEKPGEAPNLLCQVPECRKPALEGACLERSRTDGAAPRAFWLPELVPAPAASIAPL